MRDAIRFQTWYFLANHFEERRNEWEGARTNKLLAPPSSRHPKMKGSKLYQLSRQFPMFQEASMLPVVSIGKNPRMFHCYSNK